MVNDVRVARDKVLAAQSKIKTVHQFDFTEILPPGKHYFYFVRDGQKFCLSQKHPVEEYPGTNLQMNVLLVEHRHQWLPGAA